jgi:hypothetical protein
MLEGTVYAIKSVYIPISQNENIQDHRYFREVLAMIKLSHPNIVRYHCVWVEDLDLELQKKVYK